MVGKLNNIAPNIIREKGCVMPMFKIGVVGDKRFNISF